MNEDQVNYRKRKPLSPTLQLAADIGKLPPQAVDLEEAVLGALMLEKESLLLVGTLKSEMFYKEAHQKIYAAIKEVGLKAQPDILLITQQLKRTGDLELVGGPYYISQLTNRVAGAANIEFHARIILQKFIQRELIRISHETIKTAYDEGCDVLKEFELLQTRLTGIEANVLTSAKQITSDNRLQENADIFYFNGRPLGSIGNIGTIIAPPGAGKSNLVDIICSKAVCEDVDGIGFEVNLHDKGVYQGDSERSENDIIRGRRRGELRIFEAILEDDANRATVEKERLAALWHTDFLKETGSHEEKMVILERAISSEKYKLVCVDMVTDWIADPNDIPSSRALVARLGRLASKYKCFILCTIHDNPAVGQEKATGYIGSELMKRSECVILMRRLAENKEIVEITTNFQFGKGRNTSAVGNSSFMEWDAVKGYFVTSAFQTDPHTVKKSNANTKNKEIFERIFSAHKNMGMTASLLCSKYVEVTGKGGRNCLKIAKGLVEEGWLGHDLGMYRITNSPF